jgi:hypothetical protein
LLPLIIPLVLLAERTIILRHWTAQAFFIVWIVFNLILITLYGVLHQSGVVQSLLAVGSTLVERNPTVWIYWHTYMPPTFLTRVHSHQLAINSTSETPHWLGNTCHHASHIVDLNGSSLETLWSMLKKQLPCHRDYQASNLGIYDKVHLVVPFLPENVDEAGNAYAFAGELCQIPGNIYDCMEVSTFGPHLTTEDFPPFNGSIEEFYKQFALNIYKISCKDG